jgi:signal transduction histidine kinase/ligand-binding sensor domain-containing protein/DNA-binding response OmpR family regulator
MRRYFILIILFCFNWSISLGSIPDNLTFSFRRISPLGGFTYGSINSIGEDANGFIWFGTIHGLYCYNSVEVQKFLHNPQDSTTIPDNSIRTIFLDSSGTLWIGTALGVCIYDNTKDQFTTLKFRDKSGGLLGNNIRDIFEGNDKNIYLLSTSMFGRYNKESRQFEKLVVAKTTTESFACATYDSKGRIWIGGANGTVWNYDVSSRAFRVFCHHQSELIRKIFPDESGLWIGCDLSGLDFVNYQGKIIRHYGSNPGDVYKINHNRVRDINKDEAGRIWISTYKGISIIDKGKSFNILPQQVSGLPYNSIYKIFRDSKNGIWIGTWSGGLAYLSNFDNRFYHFRKEQPDSEMDDEFVSSFAEKTDKTILIGTEFGNLNMLDRESNKMINVPFNTESGKKIENIKSLYFDKETETLWVGTFLDGLWFQKKNEKIFRELKNFKDGRVSIYALARSDSGLWIGTFGKGLYHYNTRSGLMKQYVVQAHNPKSLSNNQIRSIIIGTDKSIWIGTKNGLNHFNPKTGEFQRFMNLPNATTGISNDEVLSLYQDRQGKIWIGTSGGGLNNYDKKTGKFESYQVKDGLSGDDVYGVQEDQNGILWISTDNGVSSIDPVKKIIRNFYREDELKGNQFNPGAVFQTSSGEILFGNTKGFTLFTPEQMKTNPVPPKVIFTSLSINNVIVTNHTEGSPLTRNFQNEDILKLTYDQNSLTFNFVANNFLLPAKNKFKYRLVNYDKKWIDAGTQNYATYTKIQPGDYVFEVIACNNDNLWNNTAKQLKISISPPFWLSWYAYLAYVVLLSLTFYYVLKEVIARQKFKKDLLLERLRHESEAEVQEMKLRFFTNISHEFRTPLTLISSPINLLLEKFQLETAVKEHLLTMQRNSNRLLRLVNQLIDIRKIELGKAVFQAQKTDLISLCRSVISCFEMEAKDKHIQLSFNHEFEKLNLLLDAEKAEKIFFNILSNAMKFTPANGTIGINVYLSHSEEYAGEGVVVGELIKGNMVCVEFSDNGPGIASDDLRLIFERFEQGKNHQSSGTGIGLHMAYEYTRMHKGNIRVKSKVGSGSTFTISFSLTKDIDQETEWKAENDVNPQIVIQAETAGIPDIYTEKEKIITILVIEDNYELRNYLKNLLNQQYRVVTAANGKQGLETALTILPELVISDVMMPQMDGLEVCRQLKNDILSSHIPVILLTAFSESEKQIGGLKTGADAYLTKPFDENVLLAQIENLLSSRAKLREVFSVSDSAWAEGMDVLFSDKMLIEKATAIVEKHLSDKSFVIDHLAANIGISTSSLYRKLKVLTNQSPTEFVRYIRLKKAIRLMNDGNTNVDEIGYAVGFNSHSYFTSSFKKQYGKTPSEYIVGLKTKKS